MADEMLKVSDLAERFNVDRMTVNRWKLNGYLPPPTKKPGKPAQWSEKIIQAWEADLSFVEQWAERSHSYGQNPVVPKPLRELAEITRKLFVNSRVPLLTRIHFCNLLAQIQWEKSLAGTPLSSKESKDVEKIKMRIIRYLT